MIADDTLVNYMDWLDRILKSHRIHSKTLDECTELLNTHLQELIHENEDLRVRAIINLNTYYPIIKYYKNHSSDFVSEKMQIILRAKTNLEKSLPIVNESIACDLKLSEANWSIKQIIFGKIRFLPINFDLDEILTLRNGYLGKMIYVIEGRATTFQLKRWPDPDCSIISAGGGIASEEINFAKYNGIHYINGAVNYLKDLERYDGKFVILRPNYQ